jgi:hypothetical protein
VHPCAHMAPRSREISLEPCGFSVEQPAGRLERMPFDVDQIQGVAQILRQFFQGGVDDGVQLGRLYFRIGPQESADRRRCIGRARPPALVRSIAVEVREQEFCPLGIWVERIQIRQLPEGTIATRISRKVRLPEVGRVVRVMPQQALRPRAGVRSSCC